MLKLPLRAKADQVRLLLESLQYSQIGDYIIFCHEYQFFLTEIWRYEKAVETIISSIIEKQEYEGHLSSGLESEIIADFIQYCHTLYDGNTDSIRLFLEGAELHKVPTDLMPEICNSMRLDDDPLVCAVLAIIEAGNPTGNSPLYQADQWLQNGFCAVDIEEWIKEGITNPDIAYDLDSARISYTDLPLLCDMFRRSYPDPVESLMSGDLPLIKFVETFRKLKF